MQVLALVQWYCYLYFRFKVKDASLLFVIKPEC